MTPLKSSLRESMFFAERERELIVRAEISTVSVAASESFLEQRCLQEPRRKIVKTMT